MTRKSLGFADLFFYAASMALSIRWISTAAATGPAALPGWLFAVVVFSGPLIVATAELTTRFPQEGGVYAWTQHTFGPFFGFLCGWLYWTCNLPFFSGMLYFMINLLAVAIGPAGRPLLDHPLLFMSAALALSLAAGGLHLLGLGAGKWLSNLGGASNLILFAILIGVGGAIALGKGPATHFEAAIYWPPMNANTAILWATMVFAVGGSEALAFLRNDVRGGMKTILGVLATVAGLQVIGYGLGTAGMLSILTPQEATRLSGLADALTLGLQRIGLGAFAPVALMTAFVGTLGAYSAWFGVSARIPFAAGLDSYLPPVFGRRDPKTGAPVVAIAVQMVIVVAIVILSQAGDTLKGAYDFLVAMSVLSYTLPFLFLFAVFIAVQHTGQGEAGWRAPGGRRGALLIGWIGLIGTISAVACTLVPSPDAANQLGEMLKLVFASLVLVFSGCGAYALAKIQARRIALRTGRFMIARAPTTLPAGLYGPDPAQWAKERAAIFARSWQYFAHESEIAQPRHWVAQTIAGYPILVVRDEKGELRGYHNVCRHRAGPLTDGASGVCEGHLICRYHGWAYALDGRLRLARDFGPSEDFDPRDFGLLPVRLETWRGLIFIAIDRDVAPLSAWIAPLERRLQGRDWSGLRVAAVRHHTMQCNWKTYVENYLEGYHVPLVHPALDAEIDSSRYQVTMDDKIALHEAPLRAPDPVYEGLWAWMWPTLGVNVYGVGLMVERMAPLGPSGTRLDYIYLMPEGVDVSPETMAISDAVTSEDVKIVEQVQINLDAGVYETGRLSPRHELALAAFQGFIRDALARGEDHVAPSELASEAL